MFSMRFGEKYKVKYARSGFKQDGTSYGLIAMTENENQPEGLEKPSKSTSIIKIWLPTLPNGITDGSIIVIHSFDGFDWKHIAHEQYGKVVYSDVVELRNAVIELARMEEKK